MFKISFLNRSCIIDAGNDPAASSTKYRTKYREMVGPLFSETKRRTTCFKFYKLICTVLWQFLITELSGNCLLVKINFQHKL